MSKITNKIKMCGALSATLFAAWMLVSCGDSQKSQATESVPLVDSTEAAMDSLTVPDTLPAIGDTGRIRPEPRKTR